MAKLETQELTKEELSNILYSTSRAKAILANQNANACNEVLRHTPAYKRMVKKLGEPYIAELIKCEKSEFELIEKAERDLPEFKGHNPIDQAFERSNKIIHLVARMAFVDFDLLEEILIATARDQKSMAGLAKKINR